MAELELRLTTLNHLLFRVELYEKLILDKGYEKLSTRRYRNNFNSLRNSIEFEISQIRESLKAEDVKHPKEDFTFGEVGNSLQSETEIGSLIAELNRISVEIFKESERLGIEIIGDFDITPEWIFPTSTASPISDMATIKAFLESNCSSVDDLFIDTLMTNQRVKQTFNFWKTQQKLFDRLPLLEEAIEAHIEKRFYLSVSALISQVEGLLRDALQGMSRSVDFDSMRKEDMRRATSALKDLWKSQSHNLPEATSLLDSLPDAVSDLYEEYDPAHSIEGKLYRHGVCHGLQTDFGSRKNSLRLILLLDRVIFFYAND
jgi:hypothetical protein